MKLADWLRENRVSQKAFGARIGRTEAMISLLARGKTRGSIETWIRIQGETAGAVSVTDNPFIAGANGLAPKRHGVKEI